MPASPAELFERLDDLGITTVTHRHPPIGTAAEARMLRIRLQGGHTKCLFLTDSAKAAGPFWLLLCLADRLFEVKRVARAVGASVLGAAPPEVLWQVLGVKADTITPFGLINDGEKRVRVLMDRTMLKTSLLNFHPLENTATTQISPAELVRFIAAGGHTVEVLEFGPGEPAPPPA